MSDDISYVILRRPGDRREIASGDFAIAYQEDDAPIQASVETIPVSAVGDLNRDPDILAASPDMPVELIEPLASADPDDGIDAHGNAWGITAVGAAASGLDGAGVRIAVLDTGIEASHPAFAGLKPLEKDFTGTGDGDQNGHGTHCCGTIVGRDVGMRFGVARGVTDLMVAKVLNARGGGSAGMLVKAITWAMDGRADVISMSLGFAPGKMAQRLIGKGWPDEAAWSQALHTFALNLRTFDTLMAFNRRSGAPRSLVVAAAGNDSKRAMNARYVVTASMPSAAQDVLSVAALRETPAGLSAADFSNINATLAAPGHRVRSSWIGAGLKTINGTSMACPHVAGLAALWWQSLGPRATAEMVRSKLVGETDVASLAPGYSATDVGYGLARAP